MYDAEAQDQTSEAAAWRRDALRDLAQIGLDIAASLRDQAAQGCDDDVMKRFDKIARSVRMTIALQGKLARDDAAEARKAEEHGAGITQALDEKAQAARLIKLQNQKAQTDEIAAHRRVSVDWAVSDMIKATRPVNEREDLLHRLERHLEDESESDFFEKPVSIYVEEICELLGVKPDWSLWRNKAWAFNEADLPGSPYYRPNEPLLRPPTPPPSG